MFNRWEPEDLEKNKIIYTYSKDKKHSIFSLAARFFGGFILWVLISFLMGCLLAAFCLGTYFITSMYIKYLLGAV